MTHISFNSFSCSTNPHGISSQILCINGVIIIRTTEQLSSTIFAQSALGCQPNPYLKGSNFNRKEPPPTWKHWRKCYSSASSIAAQSTCRAKMKILVGLYCYIVLGFDSLLGFFNCQSRVFEQQGFAICFPSTNIQCQFTHGSFIHQNALSLSSFQHKKVLAF